MCAHRTRHLLAALLGTAVLLLVPACSKSGGDESSSTTTTVAADATTTTASSDTTATTAPADVTTPEPTGSGSGAMTLRSNDFTDGGTIPPTFACVRDGGRGASPSLIWAGVPQGATTLVLLVHDPDAPIRGGFTHLVAAFPATTRGRIPVHRAGRLLGPMRRWIPPCPPSGTHHYVFTLYAFGPGVDFPDGRPKSALDAVADRALAKATLTGLFTAP